MDAIRSRSRSKERKRKGYPKYKQKEKQERGLKRLIRKMSQSTTEYTTRLEESNDKQVSQKKEEIEKDEQKENTVTKDADHYKYEIGERMGQYQIQKYISDGTFGRCFRVENLNNQQIYVMKVVRAVKRYIENAKVEVETLKYINSKDKDSVRYYESFKHQDNYCIVFEELGISVYDLIRKENGLEIEIIQKYSKEILKQLQIIHNNRLTHTDLKPENILLLKDNRNRLKIIDYGNATFDDEHHSSIINTKLYRAPEVILGCCRWDQKSDIWSLGCIVYELLVNKLLFKPESNQEHLAQIEKRTEQSIPQWMVRNVKQELNEYVNSSRHQFNKYQTYLRWPRFADIQRVKKVKRQISIFDKLKSLIVDDQIRTVFYQFVQQMLEIDPNKRSSVDQLLDSEFIQYDFNRTVCEEVKSDQVKPSNSLLESIEKNKTTKSMDYK